MQNNNDVRVDLKDERETAFLRELGIVSHDEVAQKEMHVHCLSQSSQWGQ